MELLIAIGIAVALVVAFDLVALRFGVDSRPTVRDDHQPSTVTPRWV